MKKYRITQDCYGFLGRYWTKGEIVEIDSTHVMPSIYFELISESEDQHRPAHDDHTKKSKHSKKSASSE